MSSEDKRGKYGAMLQQMVADIAQRFVTEFKLTGEQARQQAECAISVIQEHAGGGVFYISKGHLWHISEKHRAIYRRFTGHNHAPLAREFNLTERQIYAIVERVGREEFERKQCKLFGEGV